MNCPICFVSIRETVGSNLNGQVKSNCEVSIFFYSKGNANNYLRRGSSNE